MRPSDTDRQPNAADPVLDERTVLDMVRRHGGSGSAVTSVEETREEARVYGIDDTLVSKVQRPHSQRPRTSLEKEAFFLRILKRGDYRYEGADLGILVTRGRAMDARFQLTDRSKAWINGIRQHFKARPLTAATPPEMSGHSFKIF